MSKKKIIFGMGLVIMIILLIIVYTFKSSNVEKITNEFYLDLDGNGKEEKITVENFTKYYINNEIMDVNYYETISRIYINNKQKLVVGKGNCEKVVKVDMDNLSNEIIIDTIDGFVFRSNWYVVECMACYQLCEDLLSDKIQDYPELKQKIQDDKYILRNMQEIREGSLEITKYSAIYEKILRGTKSDINDLIEKKAKKINEESRRDGCYYEQCKRYRYKYENNNIILINTEIIIEKI